MSMLSLYTLFILLPQLHSIAPLWCVLAIISGIAMAITLGINQDSSCDSETRAVGLFFYTKLKRVFLVSSIMFFVSLFSPSREDVYYLVGGYAVTNSQEVVKLPENIVGAANAFLENYKNSIAPQPVKPE